MDKNWASRLDRRQYLQGATVGPSYLKSLISRKMRFASIKSCRGSHGQARA